MGREIGPEGKGVLVMEKKQTIKEEEDPKEERDDC